MMVPVESQFHKFYGVSKNGRNNWQTMVTVDKNKTYLGSQDDPILAAKIYDVALIQNHAMKVKD